MVGLHFAQVLILPTVELLLVLPIVNPFYFPNEQFREVPLLLKVVQDPHPLWMGQLSLFAAFVHALKLAVAALALKVESVMVRGVQMGDAAETG